ncbi:CBN-IFC-1 protein [Caenorhabditis brenneri]|uniref:CBN-IFC-1 protein n=1 Tax=Caenorhabditis brenneri TaxID=135651 RepID=G0M8Z2_CAEBE|nr:CBN-IFC-1 protein [Caenorhabditis brenneri]
MSSSYSSSRTVQYQAYGSAGGGLQTNLVSGMSSAGAICTTQIRDAREREKREIGLLNDRLADYIEKVRFLKAQNHVLAHDIEILKRGFSGGGSISEFFNSEISQCTHKSQTIISTRTKYQSDVTALSAEIDLYRTKWLEALGQVKAHREDHDVNLDKLAAIEAQIALFHRKIRIVDEDVLRIRRENGNIQGNIGRIHSQIHAEVSAKAEFSASIQSLLHRVKTITTENTSRIEQELVYIRRDTTIENRDYFRAELQAAMRDIRANYEAVSRRSREDIEIWYHKQIDKIRQEPGYVHVAQDMHKEELITIRSTMSHVQSRLAEIECRNTMLVSTITDLKHQQSEEARIFEAILAEKDAQNAKLRERCTEISIQMEKLCDHEVSLQAELERYRTLLNGANVTTYLANSSGSGLRTSQVTTTTTRTTGGYTSSSSTAGYTAGHTTGHRSGYTVGGNIGGISVGGHIDGSHVSGSVGGHHQASYSYSSSTR